MYNRLRRASAELMLLLALFATGSMNEAHAQTQASINVVAGEVFELMIDTGIQNAGYSWILTKDRLFISAQRNTVFQMRQAVTGTYVLDVNVQDAARTQTMYYSFTLNVVSSDAPPRGLPNSGVLKAKMRTEPPAVNGIVHVPAQGGIVTIDPSPSTGTIVAYDLDTNNAYDRDGDGHFENDKDTLGSYSQQSGTPMHVYVAPQSAERVLTLTVKDNQNATSVERVRIAFDDKQFVPIEPPVPMKSGVFSFLRRGQTIEFSADLPKAIGNPNDLLYEWDFADNTRSLETHPAHTYTSPGRYEVRLTVRNITTGQIVFAASAPVTITAFMAPVTSSAASEFSSSVAAGTHASSGIPWRRIMPVALIVLLLIAAAVGLFFLLMWIKDKTSGSLQQTLEKMEGKLFDTKKEPEAPGEQVAAMPIATRKAEQGNSTPAPDGTRPKAPAADVRQNIIEAELKHTDFKQRPPETPAASTGPVPSWLSNAQTKTQDTSNETQEKTPSAPSVKTSVPSWLQPIDHAPTPTSAPSTVPSPTAPVTPPSPPKPVAPVTPPSDTPAEDTLPDWLKPTASKPAASIETSPPPPTLTPTPIQSSSFTPPSPTSNPAPSPSPVQSAPVSTSTSPPAAPKPGTDPAQQASVPATPPPAPTVVPTPPTQPSTPNPPTPVAPEPQASTPKPMDAPQPAVPKPETPVTSSTQPPATEPKKETTMPAATSPTQNPNPIPLTPTPPLNSQSPSLPQPGRLTATQKRRLRRKRQKEAQAGQVTADVTGGVPANPSEEDVEIDGTGEIVEGEDDTAVASDEAKPVEKPAQEQPKVNDVPTTQTPTPPPLPPVVTASDTPKNKPDDGETIAIVRADNI